MVEIRGWSETRSWGWAAHFCIQELLHTILLPAALAIIKILGHSKLDFLDARVNHLADNKVRNAALKGTNSSQTSVMIQRDISTNDNLEKMAGEAQQLASEKGKQIWKLPNCWFDKKRKLWFGQNNNPVLPETVKFPLLTPIHALNLWSTDIRWRRRWQPTPVFLPGELHGQWSLGAAESRTQLNDYTRNSWQIALMNQHWWRNSDKATKGVRLTCYTVQSTIQGSRSYCSQIS